jgi:hypothetical protein
MSADHSSLSHHPAPQRREFAARSAVFGLIGGPMAWFLQLCAGYALASGPCFADGERHAAPSAAYAWTWPAMVALMGVGVAVALAALWVSWRAFARTRDEAGGDHHHLMEVGAGRTRFLALWGMLLGAGFALATAVTAVAFAMLPRCAG